MSAPTTTEGIADVMIAIALEDLHLARNAIKTGRIDEAHDVVRSALSQLDAARRMLL